MISEPKTAYFHYWLLQPRNASASAPPRKKLKKDKFNIYFTTKTWYDIIGGVLLYKKILTFFQKTDKSALKILYNIIEVR